MSAVRTTVYRCPLPGCEIVEPHRSVHWWHRGFGPAAVVLCDAYLAELGLSWYYKALAACGLEQDPVQPCQITDPGHRHIDPREK